MSCSPGHSFVFCSVAVAGKLEPLPSQLRGQAREVTIEVFVGDMIPPVNIEGTTEQP